MRVVHVASPGGPEVLEIVERAAPRPADGDVLIRIFAASVNRPDIQQRRGLYPPPPGASEVLGLDVAGVVESVGAGVTAYKPGDAVCALVNGGAYADYVTVPVPQCMRIPSGMTYAQAATLPEVFFTAVNTVFWLGRLQEGETLLVQGGASGVGLAAIQIARHLRGARIFATASSPEKLEACKNAGADMAFDYREDWVGQIRAVAGEQCIDVALDGQAGKYVQTHLDLLAYDGRVVLLASHQSPTTEVNTRDLVRRRLTLTGTTLRPRKAEYKGRIASELMRDVWPLIETGKITTRIHATFPFEKVRDAHALLDANEQIGKVVLLMDERAQTRPV